MAKTAEQFPALRPVTHVHAEVALVPLLLSFLPQPPIPSTVSFQFHYSLALLPLPNLLSSPLQIRTQSHSPAISTHRGTHYTHVLALIMSMGQEQHVSMLAEVPQPHFCKPINLKLLLYAVVTYY